MIHVAGTERGKYQRTNENPKQIHVADVKRGKYRWTNQNSKQIHVADAKRGKYRWTNQNSKQIHMHVTCTKLGHIRVWFLVFNACKTNPIAKLLRKLEQQNKQMSLTRRFE